MRCNTRNSHLLLWLMVMILQWQVQAYKILGVFPTFGKSHYNVGHGLFKGLADAGHEVTVVSAFKLKNPIKNYNEIYLDGVIEAILNGMCLVLLYDFFSICFSFLT